MKLVTGVIPSGPATARIRDLHEDALSICSEIWAAAPYARKGNALFEPSKKRNIRLVFYGLLDREAGRDVDVDLLEDLLGRGIPCHLLQGLFHAKIIWWRGFGAYLGSSNLTRLGWDDENAECGVFLSDVELRSAALDLALEAFFAHLQSRAVSLNASLLAELKALASLSSDGALLLAPNAIPTHLARFDDPRRILLQSRILKSLEKALRVTPPDLAWAIEERWRGEAPTQNEIAEEAGITQPYVHHYLAINEHLPAKVRQDWRDQDEQKQLSVQTMHKIADLKGDKEVEYTRRRDELKPRGGR